MSNSSGDEALSSFSSGLDARIVNYMNIHGGQSLNLDFGLTADGHWEVVTDDEVVREGSPSKVLALLLNPTDGIVDFSLDKPSQELLETMDMVIGTLVSWAPQSRISIQVSNFNGIPLFLLQLNNNGVAFRGNLSTSLGVSLADAMPLLYPSDEGYDYSLLAERKGDFFNGFFDNESIKSLPIEGQIRFFLHSVGSYFDLDFQSWLFREGYMFMPEEDSPLTEDLIILNYSNVLSYAKIIAEVMRGYYGKISPESMCLIVMACIVRYECARQLGNNGEGVEDEAEYNRLMTQLVTSSGGSIGENTTIEIVQRVINNSDG